MTKEEDNFMQTSNSIFFSIDFSLSWLLDLFKFYWNRVNNTVLYLRDFKNRFSSHSFQLFSLSLSLSLVSEEEKRAKEVLPNKEHNSSGNENILDIHFWVLALPVCVFLFSAILTYFLKLLVHFLAHPFTHLLFFLTIQYPYLSNFASWFIVLII